LGGGDGRVVLAGFAQLFDAALKQCLSLRCIKSRHLFLCLWLDAGLGLRKLL
jgi:hypothetical protein